MTHEARVALVALALCSGVVMTACTRSWAQEARCVYYEWEQVIGASNTVGPSYLQPNQVVLAQFLRSSAEDRLAAR